MRLLRDAIEEIRVFEGELKIISTKLMIKFAQLRAKVIDQINSSAKFLTRSLNKMANNFACFNRREIK